MRFASRRRRCCRSARRRWPTRCSRPDELDTPRAALPARPRRSAAAARWCRSPRRCRPRCCSATTSTSRRSRRRCCEHARGLVERLIAERRLGRRQPRRRGRQQRRLPARSTTRGRRARARHRAGAQRRRGRRGERGVPHARRVLRRRRSAASSRAEGERADVIHANNVLAHVADLNGFVAGIAIAARSTTASSSSRRPTSRTMLDHVRVRHDLPRAPLSTTRSPRSTAVPRGTASRVVDVERLPIHGGSLPHASRAGRTGAASARGRGAARRGGRLGRRSRPSAYARLRRPGRARSGATLVELLRELKAAGHAARRLRRRGQGRDAAQHARDRPRDASTSSSTATRSSRAATCRARTSRSSRPTSCSSEPPDTACCSPGTSPTRSSPSSDAYRARGGKFIIPVPTVKLI